MPVISKYKIKLVAFMDINKCLDSGTQIYHLDPQVMDFLMLITTLAVHINELCTPMTYFRV